MFPATLTPGRKVKTQHDPIVGEPLEFCFKSTGPEERSGPARDGTPLCLCHGATGADAAESCSSSSVLCAQAIHLKANLFI